MKEAEWLICAKPDLMFAHLQRQFGFRALRRKNRLFICACRRLGWDLTSTPDERVAVEVAERLADGQATHLERDTARDAARAKSLARFVDEHLTRFGTIRNLPPFTPLTEHEMLALLACEKDTRLGSAARQAAASLVQAWTEVALGTNAHQRPGSEWKEWQAKHRRCVCYYLRDIFGNPFRTLAIDLLSLKWNDRIVPKLAQAIYDEYVFDRLPILADALEEAGCTDADILNHCRQPGEHVRGCWVVDLLLGKS